MASLTDRAAGMTGLASGAAQRELGAKFSLKKFHNVVLRTGAVPLEIIETGNDAWIASEQARI